MFVVVYKDTCTMRLDFNYWLLFRSLCVLCTLHIPPPSIVRNIDTHAHTSISQSINRYPSQKWTLNMIIIGAEAYAVPLAPTTIKMAKKENKMMMIILIIYGGKRCRVKIEWVLGTGDQALRSNFTSDTANQFRNKWKYALKASGIRKTTRKNLIFVVFPWNGCRFIYLCTIVVYSRVEIRRIRMFLAFRLHFICFIFLV